MSILYTIATPIGNLADVTFRAIETFKKVDKIVCEDTRTTKKLLAHYKISTPTLSFYKKIKSGKSIKPIPKLEEIITLLKKGENLAFVTDAGTPGISDPGNQLVEKAVANKISVVPIPGVSALTTLVSIAGIDLTRFVFLGFPPHKKGRETFFRKVSAQEYPVIYYDSVYRLIKNLKLLNEVSKENRLQIIIGKELTKIYEEVIRGEIKEVLKYLDENENKIKGEFVVIVYQENKK